MSMIEVPKEEMNKSLKELQGNTNKSCKKMKKVCLRPENRNK